MELVPGPFFREKKSFKAICGELDKIQSRNSGALTAKTVLAEAKNKKSAMHSCFEWDDSIAAEKHRLHQAGDLIRNVKIQLEGNGEALVVRAFVTVKDDDGWKYFDNETVMSDAEMYAQVLERAYKDAQNYKNKYEHLEETAGIIGEIEKFSAPKINNEMQAAV